MAKTFTDCDESLESGQCTKNVNVTSLTEPQNHLFKAAQHSEQFVQLVDSRLVGLD